MAATLLQLKDQISIDAGILGNQNFPNARLTRIINIAQRYVQTQLGGLGYHKWITSQAITAGLANGAFASATTNAKKCPIDSTYYVGLLEFPKSIKFIEVNDGTNYGVAYEVDEDEFLFHVKNTYLAPSVKEGKFVRLAGYVWLIPSTITAATGYYHKTTTDLSGDTDTTQIPLEFEEHLIKRAVAEIDSINGKLQDKQVTLNQISKEIEDTYRSSFMRLTEDQREKQPKKALQ